MNKEFMQITKNEYVVTSEDGNMSLITSNSDVEEILKKENEIEETNKRILDNNNFLKSCKAGKKMHKIMIAANFIFIIAVILILCNNVKLPSYLYFIGGLIITFPITVLNIGLGFSVNSYKNTKKIQQEIEKDKKRNNTLTKEIEELKRKNNYQKIDYSQTHIKPINQPNYESEKYLVKKLTPNKKI